MPTEIIEKTIFELSHPGVKGVSLPKMDVPDACKCGIAMEMLRLEPIGLPELSEVEVMRHFVRLSTLNHHVDRGFYPLGSCTMKYNPKANEEAASMPGFTSVHPLVGDDNSLGALEVMAQLGEILCKIASHDAVTLQPAAGAHGELTGLLIIRAFHEKNKEERSEVILPDSAHGTNPASIIIAGYKPIQIISKQDGLVDTDALKEVLSEKTAALMLTNPNTLGIFEKEILKISKMVHDVGAQMYMDGANLNAILGYVSPGEIGFDMAHFNLHKTFSTPHGGGGPGAGPLSVKSHLAPFLPVPIIRRDNESIPYFDWNLPDSIGKVSTFYGNFLVMVKAWLYLRMLGAEGVKEVANWAVLNANYLLERLRKHYGLKYTGVPMHEFVIDATTLKDYGIKNIDVAKRLLDYGFHAPTMSFPLIVPDALMTEPTETESKATLDAFADTMIKIAQEAKEDPELLHRAPITTPIGRLDEGKAAKLKILKWPIPDEI